MTWDTLHILHSEADTYSAIDIDAYYDSYNLIAAFLAIMDKRELRPGNFGPDPERGK